MLGALRCEDSAATSGHPRWLWLLEPSSFHQDWAEVISLHSISVAFKALLANLVGGEGPMMPLLYILPLGPRAHAPGVRNSSVHGGHLLCFTMASWAPRGHQTRKNIIEDVQGEAPANRRQDSSDRDRRKDRGEDHVKMEGETGAMQSHSWSDRSQKKKGRILLQSLELEHGPADTLFQTSNLKNKSLSGLLQVRRLTCTDSIKDFL
ncbi:uncharacterized protein RBU33_026761 isoform 2-T2 [Hipposideros larvatus]